MATIISDLVSGEIMQMRPMNVGSLSDRLEYYLSKSYRKTASLMANSCRTVAVIDDLSSDLQNAAMDFGKYLGLCFQLTDDLLDITGTEKSLGKPSGLDLSTGVATAPVLFAAEQYPELNDMMGRKFSEVGDVDNALEFIRLSDGETIANYRFASTPLGLTYAVRDRTNKGTYKIAGGDGVSGSRSVPHVCIPRFPGRPRRQHHKTGLVNVRLCRQPRACLSVQMLARVTLLDICAFPTWERSCSDMGCTVCVERGTEVQSHLQYVHGSLLMGLSSTAAAVIAISRLLACCTASLGGYLESPTTREELAGLSGIDAPAASSQSDPAFVCRVSTPQPPQALLTISTPIYLDFVWTGTPPSATDDCALYLSYSDVSLPLTSMQWFKVANLGDCGQTLYPFNGRQSVHCRHYSTVMTASVQCLTGCPRVTTVSCDGSGCQTTPRSSPTASMVRNIGERAPPLSARLTHMFTVTIVGLVNATLPDASFMYPIGNQLNFTSDVILGPAVVTDDTPGVWGHGRPTTIVPPSPPNLPPETDVTTSSDTLVYSVVWVMAMLMVVVLSRCVLHAYRVRKQRRQHDLMRQHLTVVVNRHTSDPDVQVPAQAFTIE